MREFFEMFLENRAFVVALVVVFTIALFVGWVS